MTAEKSSTHVAIATNAQEVQLPFLKQLIHFRDCETGAVTVDWFVLTAMVIGLGALLLTALGDPVDMIGDSIANTLDDQLDP